MKLSIAMIVKNEENNIDRTLKALSCLDKKLNYEVIIVDTGSTDKTVQISKKYTDKVYKCEWTDDFSEMRNISLSHCSGEWILVLDADEVLENPDEIINFLNSEKSELFNSATVRIRNYDKNFKKVASEAVLVRMFRNSEGLKYTGRVHEQAVYKLPLAHSKISFLHYGYSTDDYELMNYKFERNKKLLEEDLKTAKGEEEIYTLFQLSKTYHFANKNNEALKYIKKAYDKELKQKDDLVHPYVYHWYASMMFNSEDYEKALEICKQLEQYCDESLDLFYMMSIIYFEFKKYDLVYKYSDKYFKLRKKRENGECNNDLGLPEASFNCYEKIVSHIITCYYKQKKYNKIIKEFEKNLDIQFEKDIEAIYIYACIITHNWQKVVIFYKGKKIYDIDVEKIIDNFNEIYMYENIKDIDRVKKELSALDKRIEIYFNALYENLYKDIEKIDFTTYYDWKKEILEKLILKDINNIKLIKKCSNEVIRHYVDMICKNYNCIDKIYKYTENNLLATNVMDLNFICNIESALLFSKAISEKKYKSLVLRILVNKSMLSRVIFNNSLMEHDEFSLLLNRYDKLWFCIENEIKAYSVDRQSYVKKLRELLRLDDKYLQVIKVFLNEATNETISIDMINEKENILSKVEKFISENKLKSAEEIIVQLENIFKWDGKIFNFKGVIKYIEGEYNDALLNLALGSILSKDKFDFIFNIACVMEKQGRVEECKKYYEEAYSICRDDDMKTEIKNILIKLR